MLCKPYPNYIFLAVVSTAMLSESVDDLISNRALSCEQVRIHGSTAKIVQFAGPAFNMFELGLLT